MLTALFLLALPMATVKVNGAVVRVEYDEAKGEAVLASGSRFTWPAATAFKRRALVDALKRRPEGVRCEMVAGGVLRVRVRPPELPRTANDEMVIAFKPARRSVRRTP